MKTQEKGGSRLGEYILELKDIGKTFSGVNVLRGINIGIKTGEVHALLGENGAGKSTLIKIISGYHQPDKDGKIIVEGVEKKFRKPKDAIDASIHTIYQELALCKDMTVAENIAVNKQDNFKGFMQKEKEYISIAEEVLTRMGQMDIKPEQYVRELSIAQQQVVEIAKAISSNAKIILMDEPTSSISQNDADNLLDLVCKLRDRGVSIIYISHRLHEIGQIADRITVLRDGNFVNTVNMKDVDNQILINMMVGREHTNIYPKRDINIGEEVLKVESLCSEGCFNEVSFSVCKGQIFGIGGLVGAKRTEILEAIFGMRKITSGKMTLKGEEYSPKNPAEAISKKVAFITEDRKKSGLVLCLSVIENMSMVNAGIESKFGYINWKNQASTAKKHKEAFNIKLHSIEQAAGTLSGGNQQKIVLSKWLDFKPDIILFDEPTRGIDICAKTEIYSIMGELAAKGVAIIMVSSELPELISVTDKIMVMREGYMKGVINKNEASQEAVMALAALQ